MVGENVVHCILRVIKGYSTDPSINTTLLVLILKMEGVESLAQCQPISICNVLYKEITRTIVNRLYLVMQKLARQNQASFIARRSILNNTVIAQEVIHLMKTTKSKKGWMAIKLYLEKVYDRLRWDFIQD